MRTPRILAAIGIAVQSLVGAEATAQVENRINVWDGGTWVPTIAEAVELLRIGDASALGAIMSNAPYRNAEGEMARVSVTAADRRWVVDRLTGMFVADTSAEGELRYRAGFEILMVAMEHPEYLAEVTALYEIERAMAPSNPVMPLHIIADIPGGLDFVRLVFERAVPPPECSRGGLIDGDTLPLCKSPPRGTEWCYAGRLLYGDEVDRKRGVQAGTTVLDAPRPEVRGLSKEADEWWRRCW